ncbi:hypothetical protein FRAAL1750 [Frankia alni ACN14a]|uniref:Uncharacterized protein n=1 Tax=Frankia alni (strain DSM 45986 / CECT 9034 / ACN14a) TaxID=326424 RepID=Q0RPX7_FRAAA|nr:hypothetical protein FRAAL1750 [Frankia alni ACN14a]
MTPASSPINASDMPEIVRGGRSPPTRIAGFGTGTAAVSAGQGRRPPIGAPRPTRGPGLAKIGRSASDRLMRGCRVN